MKDSQLIDALKALNKAEFTGLIKFADSPFFSKGRNYVPFLKELKKFMPDFNSEKLTKQYIYSRLYQGKKFNSQVIKNLMNGLMRIIEQYLIILGINNDRTEGYLRLGEEMQYRRIIRPAGRVISKAYNELQNSRVDSYYFSKMSRIMHTERELLRKKNELKKMTQITKSITSYHYISFYTELAFLMHELRASEINMNMKFDTLMLYSFASSPVMNEMIETIKNEPGQIKGVIEIYRGMMMLIVNNSDEAIFEKTIKLFAENISHFSRTGKHQLLIFLLAASTRLETINKEKYRRTTFDLMKIMMETESYSAVEGLAMNIGTFRNMIVCSLSLNEFNWSEKFLKEHIDKLLPEHRDNMYNFSYARLSFEKKRFEKALEYLSKVKFEMFAFKYDVKVLMLRVYYELNLFEQAYSLIDTFKHFINENKQVSPRKRSVHQNFLKFTEALLKKKEGRDTFDPAKMKSSIASSAPIIEKSWLLAKISEFED